MARPIVCDVCGASDMLDAYGLAPVGWFKIDERTADAKFDPKDLCGAPCAEQYLRDLSVGRALAAAGPIPLPLQVPRG